MLGHRTAVSTTEGAAGRGVSGRGRCVQVTYEGEAGHADCPGEGDELTAQVEGGWVGLPQVGDGSRQQEGGGDQGHPQAALGGHPAVRRGPGVDQPRHQDRHRHVQLGGEGGGGTCSG